MPRPMSAQTRNENEMKENARRQMLTAKDPIEKMRLACLLRGSTGILGMARIFRRMDDNESGDLSTEEFKKGLDECGLLNEISDEDADELFKHFDKDGSGTINYNEFVRALRPPMNPARSALVERAFEKLDKTEDGKITLEDLSNVYNVKSHPDYLNGQYTEKQLLKRFLHTFEAGGVVDGVVTREEFFDYYSGISASIDEDAYFDLMMRTCWKLN